MKKLGQISIEYLIVISFVTFIVLTVLGIALFYSSQIQDTIKINELERFSSKLASASESTFFSGEPSRNTVKAYLPHGVQAIMFLEDNLVIDIETYGGVSRIAYPINVPVNGTISTSPGLKKILIVADSNQVTLSES